MKQMINILFDNMKMNNMLNMRIHTSDWLDLEHIFNISNSRSRFVLKSARSEQYINSR